MYASHPPGGPVRAGQDGTEREAKEGHRHDHIERRGGTPLVTEFTPVAALTGGGLIGLSAALLMATLGRVMGATGILAGAFAPADGRDLSWRVALLAGMMTAPFLWLLVTGRMPAIDVPVGTLSMVVGGLLVGIGVTLGSGCTSGHGVCGVARLSPRSIVATLTFMIFTALTVWVTRHLVGG